MSRGALALAALLPAAVALAGEEAKGAPRMSIEPMRWDFGRAFPDERLRKSFSVQNVGDAELLIEGVTTTCGCTVARGYEKRIPAGGRTPLEVILETRQSSGRLEKSVLVRTNDPRTPLVEIKVSATVVARSQ
jgi:hypothetical protein